MSLKGSLFKPHAGGHQGLVVGDHLCILLYSPHICFLCPSWNRTSVQHARTDTRPENNNSRGKNLGFAASEERGAVDALSGERLHPNGDRPHLGHHNPLHVPHDRNYSAQRHLLNRHLDQISGRNLFEAHCAVGTLLSFMFMTPPTHSLQIKRRMMHSEQ